MTVAIYPGSFDPITNGHLDVAGRREVAADAVEEVEQGPGRGRFQEQVIAFGAVVTITPTKHSSFPCLL